MLCKHDDKELKVKIMTVLEMFWRKPGELDCDRWIYLKAEDAGDSVVSVA